MLGYRGFVVHGQPPVRVFRGAVLIGGEVRTDVHGAEAWLMRSARAQGWAAIVDAVTPP